VGEFASQLSLDLDDQVYFIDGHFDIWETFKISGKSAIEGKATVLPFGSYSNGTGLNVSSMQLWDRRRDLQVRQNT